MLQVNKNYSPQKIRGITWPLTAKKRQENERVRVGERKVLNALSALTSDGQEIQKEENDTLITDNKKLRIHWRRLDTNDQFGGPECRSGDTPSISNQEQQKEQQQMATRKTGGLDPQIVREIEKQTQKQQEIDNRRRKQKLIFWSLIIFGTAIAVGVAVVLSDLAEW